MSLLGPITFNAPACFCQLPALLFLELAILLVFCSLLCGLFELHFWLKSASLSHSISHMLLFL